MDIQGAIVKAWYQGHWSLHFLRPLAWLFSNLARSRRAKQSRNVHSAVPVIVVGNITLGGTGKTPLLIALVKKLQAEGYRPGVISRGFGRGSESAQAIVHADRKSTARTLGDEPYLIYQECGCPLAVGQDRAAVVSSLLARHELDVILSDDGLQHYRLARSMEIAVIDGARGLGNAYCLPAGPLREPPARLQEVDLLVVNGELAQPLPAPARRESFSMSLEPDCWQQVKAPAEELSLDAFQAGASIAAVAGIGHPQRFFKTLSNLGLTFSEKSFADHHNFEACDIPEAESVLMTTKDAVKCRAFAQDHWWALKVSASLSDTFWESFLAQVGALIKAHKSST